MKILICSDSHGDNDSLDRLVALNPNCDLYLHAGDSASIESMILPFESVRGNCDYFGNFMQRRIFDTPYGKILLQHYPDLPKSIIKEYNIRVFIHGHTHIRRFETVENITVINPGAISYPRDNYDKSYAILKLEKEKIEIEFKTL